MKRTHCLLALLAGIVVSGLQWVMVLRTGRFPMTTPYAVALWSAIPGEYVAIIFSGNAHGGSQMVAGAANLVIYAFATYGLFILWDKYRF
jgi:hypothetical protein